MCVLTENKHADSNLPHSMQASWRPFLILWIIKVLKKGHDG